MYVCVCVCAHTEQTDTLDTQPSRHRSMRVSLVFTYSFYRVLCMLEKDKETEDGCNIGTKKGEETTGEGERGAIKTARYIITL